MRKSPLRSPSSKKVDLPQNMKKPFFGTNSMPPDVVPNLVAEEKPKQHIYTVIVYTEAFLGERNYNYDPSQSQLHVEWFKDKDEAIHYAAKSWTDGDMTSLKYRNIMAPGLTLLVDGVPVNELDDGLWEAEGLPFEQAVQQLYSTMFQTLKQEREEKELREQAEQEQRVQAEREAAERASYEKLKAKYGDLH